MVCVICDKKMTLMEVIKTPIPHNLSVCRKHIEKIIEYWRKKEKKLMS